MVSVPSVSATLVVSTASNVMDTSSVLFNPTKALQFEILMCQRGSLHHAKSLLFFHTSFIDCALPRETEEMLADAVAAYDLDQIQAALHAAGLLACRPLESPRRCAFSHASSSFAVGNATVGLTASAGAFFGGGPRRGHWPPLGKSHASASRAGSCAAVFERLSAER